MSRLRQQNLSSEHSYTINSKSHRKTWHFHTIENHPIGGLCEMFSPCSLLSSNLKISVMKPQPKYGEHTKDIMKNVLKYKNDEIERMIENETVGVQWSNHYIPDGNTDLNPWNKVKNEYEDMMKVVRTLRLVDTPPMAKL